MTRKPPVVYISYCRSSAEDTAFAKQLAERLRGDGVRSLLDVWELRPGMDIDGWYSAAIRSSNFAIMIGSKALTAKWREKISQIDFKSLRELIYYQHTRCIPVLFPGISSRDLPPPFDNRVGVQMDPDNSDIGYTQLLYSLTGRNAVTAPPVRERNPSSRDPSQSVFLKRLTLSNFRRAQQLELVRSEAAPGPTSEPGQWTILLGDNGTGKSSVLWAIGMGLLDRDLVQAILPSISSPLIQFGQSECSVQVTETSTTYHVQLAHSQGREVIDDSSGSPDFMIFGYGISRGSAFGGPQRSVELDRPLNAINTLYGIPTNLIHAETWIEGLERNALKAGEATEPGQLFPNVCDVLKSVLPGIDEIVLDEERIRFIGPSVGDCTIDCLSDGYATTLGWMAQLNT